MARPPPTPPWTPEFISFLQSIWHPGMRYAELEEATGLKVDSLFMGRLEVFVRGPWKARSGQEILPPWTQHELARLQEMRLDGRTCGEIGAELGRSEAAVSKIARFYGYNKTFNTRRRAPPPRKPMRLSKNFTVEEMTRTNAGLDNEPEPQHLVNLAFLCELILEPLRERWGGHPVRVNSGYRSVAVNAKVKGATTSDHMRGCAADIEIPYSFRGDAFRVLHQLWTDGEIPLLRQAIRYGDGDRPHFIHVSIEPPPAIKGKGQFLWTPSGGTAGGPYYTYRPVDS